MKLNNKKKILFTRKNQENLLQLCLKKDKRAQLTIYNQYYKAMYNICLYMVKDGFVAEELMQDAFLSAFDKLATFKGDVSFGAWLKRIVINKCLDYLKIKKATFTSLTDKNDVVSEEETDIEQIELQAQVVKEAILNLPEGYRTIVTLYLLEGFDHSEIAEILGISASTSRSQYYRAKSLLIKMIQKQNGAV